MLKLFVKNFVEKMSASVSILPSSIGNVLSALKDTLSSMLMRFNADIGGVICSYDNVTFDSEYPVGIIINDSPFIHFDFHFTACCFCPISSVGSTLLGRVTQISDSHISLLVLGIINAFIMSDNMGPHISYDESRYSWGISIGDFVYFQVLSVTSSSDNDFRESAEGAGLICIEGSRPVLVE